MERKRIPGYLVDLADIMAAFPSAEAFVLVELNMALEKVRRFEAARCGWRAQFIPDLVCLNEYYEVGGLVGERAAPPPAERGTGTPGRVLPFRGVHG